MISKPQGGSRHGPARPGTAIAHLKPQLRKSLLFTRTHSFASQRIRNAFASHRNRTESDFPFRKLTHLQTPIFTRLDPVSRFLGFLRLLPYFPMHELTYCTRAGPKYVVAESQSKKSRKKPRNLNTYTQNHPLTYINQIWIHKRGGRGFAAAPPFGDGYWIYIGEWVILCVGV